MTRTRPAKPRPTPPPKPSAGALAAHLATLPPDDAARLRAWLGRMGAAISSDEPRPVETATVEVPRPRGRVP